MRMHLLSQERTHTYALYIHTLHTLYTLHTLHAYFQELTHSPEVLLGSLQTILDNALDLDAGRYVREGASRTIMYAVRLAVRVEQFVRYLLSPQAEFVRGLRILPGQYADRVRERLVRGAKELRTKLEEHALPVLQARARAAVVLPHARMYAPCTCAPCDTPGPVLPRAAGLARQGMHAYVHVACT